MLLLVFPTSEIFATTLVIIGVIKFKRMIMWCPVGCSYRMNASFFYVYGSVHR